MRHRRQKAPDLFSTPERRDLHPRMVSSNDVDWKGPGSAPHEYSPDHQAQGDCNVCGHTYQSHLLKP